MKKKFNIYITAQVSQHTEGGIRYEAWDMDMSGESGRILITKTELEVEISTDDMRPQFVGALREEQQKIRAESERQVTRIEERIQSLLCIESK